MTTAFFLQGALLGLAVAAPVGPIGLLCFRRALESGALAGLAGGAGTALADGLYAAAAAFGLAAVAEVMHSLDPVLRLGGGAVLLWLAWGTWRRPVAREAASGVGGATLLRAFWSTFLLTLANPATILSFTAVFAGLGLTAAAAQSPTAAGAVVAGVVAGSLGWWVVFSGVAAWLGRRLPDKALGWVNRGSALVLAGFAVAAAWPLVG